MLQLCVGNLDIVAQSGLFAVLSDEGEALLLVSKAESDYGENGLCFEIVGTLSLTMPVDYDDMIVFIRDKARESMQGMPQRMIDSEIELLTASFDRTMEANL